MCVWQAYKRFHHLLALQMVQDTMQVVSRKTGDNTIALVSASQAAIEFFLPQTLHCFKRLGTTHEHLVIVAHSPASLKVRRPSGRQAEVVVYCRLPFCRSRQRPGISLSLA